MLGRSDERPNTYSIAQQKCQVNDFWNGSDNFYFLHKKAFKSL
jgi:hypothetical protein